MIQHVIRAEFEWPDRESDTTRRYVVKAPVGMTSDEYVIDDEDVVFREAGRVVEMGPKDPRFECGIIALISAYHRDVEIPAGGAPALELVRECER